MSENHHTPEKKVREFSSTYYKYVSCNTNFSNIF